MKKLLIILCVFISFYGCRTVKKDWVKENYTSKIEAVALSNDILKETKRLNAETESKIDAKYSEILQEVKESSIIREDETTTVKGTIEAEEGKEKTAEIGNTKIKSNGANISFETTSTKAISKEFKSRYQQLEKKLLEFNKKIEWAESEINSLEKQIANLSSSLETEKAAKTKEKNSKGLTFGTIITLFIIIAIAGLVWYYWKRISAFFGRFKK